MAKYRFQVCLNKGTDKERWSTVCPTFNGKVGLPYEYNTYDEAKDMARMCYGNDPSLVRVVEVPE